MDTLLFKRNEEDVYELIDRDFQDIVKHSIMSGRCLWFKAFVKCFCYGYFSHSS